MGIFFYLYDGVRYLRTGHNRVCTHHPVGVFLADFRNQKSTHTSTSTTTQRMRDLETYHVRKK